MIPLVTPLTELTELTETPRGACCRQVARRRTRYGSEHYAGKEMPTVRRPDEYVAINNMNAAGRRVPRAYPCLNTTRRMP
jgi:hypothetical protein